MNPEDRTIFLARTGLPHLITAVQLMPSKTTPLGYIDVQFVAEFSKGLLGGVHVPMRLWLS